MKKSVVTAVVIIIVGFIFAVAMFQDDSWSAEVNNSSDGWPQESRYANELNNQNTSVIQQINYTINKQCICGCKKYDDEQLMQKQWISGTK
ncbi:hypothetical protein [Bacillus sp. NP247]|uniref:hypothetical protein n=1 Tax=Bacillus sp. NP247 TaxID=2846779 RepID=UPI001C631427|nr:hypothetical protein [Bacillus sp. NP247]QWU45887.1 hypothetical protein KPL75_02765 [Bacillus sp. NP247]